MSWLLFALSSFFLLAYYVSPWLWLTALAGLGFVVLAYLRLDLALILVLFAAPFYRYPKAYGSLEFSLVEFAVLGCFAAWVARVAVWSTKARNDAKDTKLRSSPFRAFRVVSRLSCSKRVRGPTVFALPALFFALAAVASLSTSEVLNVSLRELRVVVVEPLLLYLMLVTTLRGERQVWRYLNAFVALGAGMAAFGLYHYVFVGMVEEVEGVGRMLAIYHSPNALGLFLGRVAPVALTLAAFGAGRRGGLSIDHPLARACYAGAAALLLLALFLTFSRGAWFGVAAAMLLVTALQGRRFLLASAGAAAAAMIGAAPFVWERLASWTTTLRRLYVWQAALEMWRDHPLFGVGLDNFLHWYPEYVKEEAAIEPTLSHPHNLLLDYATRLGVPGVLALLWLQAAFWLAALRLYRGASSPSVRLAVLALMASMADFVAHGLVDNSYFLIDLAYVFWLTTGLLAVMIAYGAGGTSEDPHPAPLPEGERAGAPNTV